MTTTPTTKRELCEQLLEHAHNAHAAALDDERLERLYRRLQERGLIRHAPAIGVYLTRELTAEDIALD